MHAASVGRGAVSRTAVLAALCVAGTGATVQAQEQRLSLPLGETDLYPELRVEQVFNDNAYLAADDEVEARGTVVSPTLDWVAERRLLRLNGRYRGDYAAYDEEALDYADHELSLRVDAELGARRRTAGGIVYRRGHEGLGFELTRGIAEAVDDTVTFDSVEVDGRFRYGASDARGNVEGGARIELFRYANLEELTEGLDYVVFAPYALFSLRISSDSRWLIEAGAARYDYEDDELDRTDVELLTGLEFSATGALSGSARIGARRSLYAEDELDDEATLALESDLEYRPVDFVRLRLFGERQLANALRDAEGGQPLRTTLRLDYRHDWSSRFYHVAFVGQRFYQRDCPSRDVRVDFGGLELNLRPRRWLELGVGARADRREADDCPGTDDVSDLDFARSVLGVHLRATL